MASDLYAKFNIPEPKVFGQNLEIMMAEPHNELRLILTHHLNKLGFNKVRACRDGKVAISELKLKPADIVMAGDDLPSVAGLDLLKELREDTALIRETFVLICKPASKQEVMLAVESGVDDLLLKPIAPNDILPKLRSAYAAFSNPKNPERVYEFAKGRLREGDMARAKTVYEALAAENPKAARPYVGMGRIFLQQNQIDPALIAVNNAIARNENYVHAFSLRAEIYVKQGEVQKAKEDFKKAASISPLNIARYESSCEFLIKNNLIDACIEILEMAVNANMEHLFVVERLGYCYFVQKDYPKALRFLKQAVRLDPEGTTALNSLAICYRDAKQYDDAIEIYNQILKKENDNYHVMFNKALVCVHMGKKDEAVKLFKRALKINPDFEKAKDKILELGGSLHD